MTGRSTRASSAAPRDPRIPRDDAALGEVATSMRKLHEALRDRQGEAARRPRTAEPRFAGQIRRGADEAAGP